MNLLKFIFGGGQSQKSPIEAVGNLFDELFTSDEERNAAEIVLKRLEQEPGKLQANINLIEAGSRSVFVAGWRPFIGWVCGLALASFYIPQYLAATGVWLMALHANGFTSIPVYPVQPGGLMELVLGMLGMGTLRTAEKAMGKTK